MKQTYWAEAADSAGALYDCHFLNMFQHPSIFKINILTRVLDSHGSIVLSNSAGADYQIAGCSDFALFYAPIYSASKSFIEKILQLSQYAHFCNSSCKSWHRSQIHFSCSKDGSVLVRQKYRKRGAQAARLHFVRHHVRLCKLLQRSHHDPFCCKTLRLDIQTQLTQLDSYLGPEQILLDNLILALQQMLHVPFC